MAKSDTANASSDRRRLLLLARLDNWWSSHSLYRPKEDHKSWLLLLGHRGIPRRLFAEPHPEQSSLVRDLIRCLPDSWSNDPRSNKRTLRFRIVNRLSQHTFVWPCCHHRQDWRYLRVSIVSPYSSLIFGHTAETESGIPDWRRVCWRGLFSLLVFHLGLGKTA